MTQANAGRFAGAAALTLTCLGVTGPALASAATGSATFSNPTCTKDGRQVSVSIIDSSTGGGADYTLVSNSGAVTPASATVFQGGTWNKVVTLSGNATHLYVYASGQPVGETTFSACDSTSTSSSAGETSPSSATTTTNQSASSDTDSAIPTQTSAALTPPPSVTTTSSGATSSPAAHVVPGAAPTSSVQQGPKSNPQGAAGPLKWGAAIALVLGGLALAGVYFRREFKR